MVDQQHLQEQLAKDYKLLKKLEDKLRLEDDPKRQAKLELDIEELREQIQERESQKALAAQSDQDSQESIDELIQQVRVHCCEKIQDLYSKIRLLNFQRVDVDRLYVEVHILRRPASGVYATIPGLLQGHAPRNNFDRFGLGEISEKRLPGLYVANRFSRLMVLGKPGSGKSTFLRYLAIACCKGKFLPDHIPVLIELRSIENGLLKKIRKDIKVSLFNRSDESNPFNLFLELIQRELQLTTKLQVKQTLNTGKILLLLDGLDEVPEKSRRSVQEHISKFVQQFYKVRVILTCRTQTTEYSLLNFEDVEVANFNPEQVEIFAENWFAAIADIPEQEANLASRFMSTLRLPEHQRTAELAVTPVLLSLTCWIFQDTGDLPIKRVELYQQGLDLLLEQWDTKRGINERTLGGKRYRSLDIERKQELLSYIAVRKFEKEQFALFEQQEIQSHIENYFRRLNQKISNQDSRDVLRAIEAQHGLLIERASHIYSFSHLTFQEFFAAKWFCDPDNRQNLISYLADARGQELIRFALQMPAHADDIVQSIKQSIDGLLEADVQLQQFLTWLHQKACCVDSPYQPAAVRAFYFAVVRNHDHIDNSNHDFDLDFARNLDLARAHASDLDLDLNHTLAHDLGLDDLISDLDLDFDLDLNLTHVYAYAHALDLDLELIYARALTRAYDRVYARIRIPELTKLQLELQPLTQQLPSSEKNWNYFQQWWQKNGKDWITQLRTVMIEHRNIGHEWQFSEKQKILLQQYHDVNKRLVSLLQSDCEVSPLVRQGIEETLLLPITEIEKRKN